jgi:hypothetical protein
LETRKEKHMADKLLIAVLGNRNSGKSKTWNTLFGSTVKTGSQLRYLYLNKAQWVDDVFLIAGSSEERGIPVEEIMPKELSPAIVLCSVQYRDGMRATFDYFFTRGYDVIVQWLNPGYSDESAYTDDLNAVDWLLSKGAVVAKRDGQNGVEIRVEEIRQYILGWATYRDLVKTEF